MKKKQLSFLNIWNMSFGFLGIQFAFALQGAFASRIFQTLGAEKDEIPLLWIFAPLAGLIVQPIIGYLSDRTWSDTFGRRKPYFLIGAIMASSALIFMPHSPFLWAAVGSLLVLDASVNISMEPFRALVADLLPDSQRSYGFIVQTLIIGIGTWFASNLPSFLSTMGASTEAVEGVLPSNVKWSFFIGGLILLTSIIYTILTTKEYPPEDMEAFLREKEESRGFFNGFNEILDNIINMPKTMLKLGIVQFFSWFAFFTMWSMATPALTEHIFNSPKPESAGMDPDKYVIANQAFNVAADSVGSAMGTYGLSSMVFALLLTFVASRTTINRKYVHMISLLIGGVGFMTMYFINSTSILHLCFAAIGIAWGSILSMPYAMLSSTIEAKKMGIYMGIFNMFIVIPQIVAALGGINLAYVIFGDETINAMILAGCCLIIAGLCNFLITNPDVITYKAQDGIQTDS